MLPPGRGLSKKIYDAVSEDALRTKGGVRHFLRRAGQIHRRALAEILDEQWTVGTGKRIHPGPLNRARAIREIESAYATAMKCVTDRMAQAAAEEKLFELVYGSEENQELSAAEMAAKAREALKREFGANSDRAIGSLPPPQNDLGDAEPSSNTAQGSSDT